MKRKYILTGLSSLLIFCLSFFPLFVENAKAENSKDLPEQEGEYDVPGHPKLKLRVFVYRPEKPHSPGKPLPTPTPTPAEVCQADSASDNQGGLTGWRLKEGATTYRLNLGSVPSSVGGTNLITIAARSFNAWQSTTDLASSIYFSEGSPTSISKASFDGQNIITWGRASGSALAVTYTWYNRETREVIENDTIMNLKFPWAWFNNTDTNLCAYSGYYDAQNILTHELGHWVGLNDEYTEPFVHNTMYGYGSKNEVKKNTLTQGDIQATNAIYSYSSAL